MSFCVKLLALFRRPKPPVAPLSPYLEAEFLEAVAKLARERYRDHQFSREPDAPRAGQEQAA